MPLRERKDRVPYQLWTQQGHIIATPGNVVDQEMIRQQILVDADVYDVRDVAFDEWNSAKLATELGEAGILMVKIRQNFEGLTAATKHLEGLVLAGRLMHGGNPVLRWNAGNVVLLRDTNDNYRRTRRNHATGSTALWRCVWR